MRLPDRNPSALYAFETNDCTRRMLKERLAPGRPIREPDDLLALAEFIDQAFAPRVSELRFQYVFGHRPAGGGPCVSGQACVCEFTLGSDAGH